MPLERAELLKFNSGHAAEHLDQSYDSARLGDLLYDAAEPGKRVSGFGDADRLSGVERYFCVRLFPSRLCLAMDACRACIVGLHVDFREIDRFK
jgi:hypothetical protein